MLPGRDESFYYTRENLRDFTSVARVILTRRILYCIKIKKCFLATIIYPVEKKDTIYPVENKERKLIHRLFQRKTRQRDTKKGAATRHELIYMHFE